MNTLEDLEQRIQKRIAIAHSEKTVVETAAQRAENERGKIRFGEVADRLLRDVIDPRIEKLVTYFENAEIVKPDQLDHRYSCLARFHASPRFPTTARLDLTLSHDERVEHLLVLYRLEVGPNYVPFRGQVQLVFPIDNVDHDQLVRWLDDQIVDFVDAYVCFEYPGVSRSLVVDPVCGMALNKPYVAAESNYRGQTYYFCADNCRKEFDQNPARYISPARAVQAELPSTKPGRASR